MGRPVAELLASMSSREFSEWMAYAELEPFGEERRDHRAGVIAAAVATVGSGLAGKSKAFSPADFFPDLAGEPEELTPEQTAARFGA